MAQAYINELATQTFVSIKQTIEYLTGYVNFKKDWEKSFSKVMDLTGEEIKQGYIVLAAPPNTPEGYEPRAYILDYINESIEAVASAEKSLRKRFVDDLNQYLTAVEKGRKPERLIIMRRRCRISWTLAVDDDRAKYDEKIMKQMDLIISLSEGVGFKARQDLRSEISEGMPEEEDE